MPLRTLSVVWAVLYDTYYNANTLQTQREWMHGAGCARPRFRTAEPLGERRYKNWPRGYAQLS